MSERKKKPENTRKSDYFIDVDHIDTGLQLVFATILSILYFTHVTNFTLNFLNYN